MSKLNTGALRCAQCWRYRDVFDTFLSNHTARLRIHRPCSCWEWRAVFLPHLYIGWQWRNFFISYLCQLLFRHVGQALRSVSYSDITFLVR